MSKKELIKKIKEIASKDKMFKGATLYIDITNKQTGKKETIKIKI